MQKLSYISVGGNNTYFQRWFRFRVSFTGIPYTAAPVTETCHLRIPNSMGESLEVDAIAAIDAALYYRNSETLVDSSYEHQHLQV